MSIVSNSLLRDTVCLGKERAFVDVSNGCLQLVPNRPEDGVITRIEELLDNSGDRLIAELSSYSVSQIENLVTNLTYLSEKLNTDSRLQVNISEFFKVVLGGFFAIGMDLLQKGHPSASNTNLVLAFSVGFCALPVLHNMYTYANRWRRTGVTQSDCTRLGEKITNFVMPILSKKRSQECKQHVRAEQERGIQLAAIDKLFTTVRFLGKPRLEDILLYRNVTTFIQTKQAEQYSVFLHGQSLRLAMISRFLSKLLARIEPDRDLADFQCVRFITKKDADSCPSHKRNIKDFLKSEMYLILEQLNCYDELISVTVNPFDNTPTETAFYYWHINGNVKQDVPKVVINDIKRCFNITEAASAAIKDTLAKIDQVLCRTQWPRSGNLVAICVPKATLEDPKTCIAYRSYPWGIPRHPLAPQEIIKYLTRNWTSSDSCQARLLTTQLIPENHVKTYHFNTLSISETKECDSLLDALVDRVMQDSHNLRPALICQ